MTASIISPTLFSSYTLHLFLTRRRRTKWREVHLRNWFFSTCSGTKLNDLIGLNEEQHSRRTFCLSRLFHRHWVIMRAPSLLHYRCTRCLPCKHFVYKIKCLAELEMWSTFLHYRTQDAANDSQSSHRSKLSQQYVSGTDSERCSPLILSSLPRDKSQNILTESNDSDLIVLSDACLISPRCDII